MHNHPTLLVTFSWITWISLVSPWSILALEPDQLPERETRKFVDHFLSTVKRVVKHHIRPASEEQLVQWGIESLYASVKEPVPKVIAAGLQAWNTLPVADQEKLIRDARLKLGRREVLKDGNDLEVSVTGLMARLEPFEDSRGGKVYLRPEEITPITGGPRSNPSDVGLILEKDKTTGFLRVVTPLYYSPAYRKGIRAGDLITHIQVDRDKDGARQPKPVRNSTKDLTLPEARQMLIGRAGTRVILTVIQADLKKD